MNTRILSVSAALLAALPLAAPAQTPPLRKASPVTLRYQWTPGDVRHYRMTMDTNMTMAMSGQAASNPRTIPPITEHMVLAYNTTVQSVNPADGSATLTEHITGMTFTMNGKTLPLGSSLTNAYKDGFTVVMSPAGKMLSMHLPPSVTGKMPAGMDVSKIGSFAPALLPPGPVHVGDTWQGGSDMSSILGQIPHVPALQMTLTSSLAALSAGARPVASIRQSYQGTIGTGRVGMPKMVKMTGQLRGSSLLKFDVGKGSVIGQDGTAAMNMSVVMPKMPTTPTAKTMQMHVQMTTHLESLPGTL